MINRPNAVVSDQEAVPAQVRRRSGIKFAVSRSCATDNAGRSRLRREPYNSTLPVVTMSQPSRRRVLRHVPSVHDSESAVVRAAASVDLAGAAAAHIGWATGRVETGAERACQLVFRIGLPALLPSVATRIYSWEWHAATFDFQERLVLQVQRTKGAAGNSLRESNDRIVVDHCAAFERYCERCN